ncbi:MAG: hypothetical protein ACRKFN_07560 [Desulfitobacterium sp.]
MKKFLPLVFIFCLTTSLVGCSGKTYNTGEMLGVIAKELDLDVSVQLIDTIELDDVVLACYMTGNEYQAHTYGYAEFEKRQNGYKYLRTYSTMERGMDLRSAIYHGSYLFISNNMKSQNLRIQFENGKEKLIVIDKIPFVYYLENASNFEYHFLDKDGKELSP